MDVENLPEWGAASHPWQASLLMLLDRRCDAGCRYHYRRRLLVQTRAAVRSGVTEGTHRSTYFSTSPVYLRFVDVDIWAKAGADGMVYVQLHRYCSTAVHPCDSISNPMTLSLLSVRVHGACFPCETQTSKAKKLRETLVVHPQVFPGHGVVRHRQKTAQAYPTPVLLCLQRV